MPKPVYQIFLGVFMLAFVVVACDNKKSETKETIKDTIPVVDTLKNPGDTLFDKPVDPGTVPKPPPPDGGQ